MVKQSLKKITNKQNYKKLKTTIMKKVFSDQSKVAHLWANKVQDEATNSGRSFFFNRETIYSYGHHFPIAKHVQDQDGKDYVLFTERGYSNTTSKHIAITRGACNHKDIVYCYSPESGPNINFDHWLKNIEAEIDKLARARKPELYLNNIENVATKVKRYSQYTGNAIPEKLIEAMKITDKDQYAGYQENRIEQAKKAQKQAEIELQARHKEELEKWQNFETSRLYLRDGSDYLRVNSENDRIETTQAVHIPNEIARRLWLAIKENTLKVGDKILYYNVDKADKIVKIGCHTFKRSYLLEFGAKLYQSV
jgi:hypothetical protein